MKNKIIIVVLIVVLLIAGVVFVISKKGNNEQEQIMKPSVDLENTDPKAPSKIEDDEKQVDVSTAKDLFEFIPKIYTEAIAPFDSIYMLDAVMGKLTEDSDEVDFSAENIDGYVKKIFGKDAVIDKEKVSTPDITKSVYYYSKEANSYAVVPIGYEGIFNMQIYKNATETKDAYYVYAYAIAGIYTYDENSLVVDEYGDVNYENAKVEVIVGDKDGMDLVHTFNNFDEMYIENNWLELYKNKMPVLRYTLKKDGNSYYLTEVEQLNY